MSEIISIFIKVKDLRRVHVLRGNEVFAVVYQRDLTSLRLNRLYTTGVNTDQNPVFPDNIALTYHFEASQEIVIRFFNVNAGADLNNEDLHEFLGDATFRIASLMTARNNLLTLQLSGRDGNRAAGECTVRAESAYDAADVIHFTLKFEGLRCMRFAKTHPFIRIYRRFEDREWVLCYQTKSARDSQNPVFEDLHALSRAICNGDLYCPLRLEILARGDRHLIGELNFTIRRLEQWSTSGDAIPLTYPVNDGNPYGTMRCSNFRICADERGFPDYVLAGHEISLIVAVDYTVSNLPITDPESRHFLHPTGAIRNDYQQAIFTVGTILSEYDSDKKYPFYGFGARQRVNNVLKPASHCFTGSKEEVVGVDGLLEMYHEMATTMHFAGPTLFAPLLEKAIHIAEECVKHANGEVPKYTILLILTDGELLDMEDTKDAIVRASHLPISIIFVGIGNGGEETFKDLIELDADREILKDTHGNTAERDIVQFVCYRDLRNAGAEALSQEVLAEIPMQYCSYMLKYDLKPGHSKKGESHDHDDDEGEDEESTPVTEGA